ncbi:hypothetical protein [Demequina phytophila]|uniref:hypothetical protein n=1 Tax=Demequina phytophila TaxID=1638981 RepID=UPI000AC5933C|nr:hypothetical protein [Demequina phytophila]
MTVPHISVASWGPRITREVRVLRPSRSARANAVASPRAVGATGIAWIDVAVQLVLVAALAFGIYWVVAVGVFHQGVEAFTQWYVGDVVPSFAIGGAPVVAGDQFEEGFFAPHPEVPTGLTWNAPSALAFEAQFGR